jgi:putative DNA primase/helicase
MWLPELLEVSMNLTTRHLEDLRKSGLSDEQIERCGFHSLQAPASIQAILRWKLYKGDLGDCLAIPFMSAEGQRNGYCRLKPDRPRKGKEAGNKPVKYESPKGLGNHAYFPPGTIAALKDPAIPLLLTEGEKKAAKADQEGFPCIAMVGVYGWQKKRTKDKDGKATGPRELIDMLLSVNWTGRSVYILFDSDAAANENVLSAEWHLAETMTRHGASVKIVRLPQPGQDKVGLDDFLVANSADALRELIATATEPKQPKKTLKVLEAADDPHRLAGIHLKECCEHTDGLTLRQYRDEWFSWEDTWRVLPDRELASELTITTKAEMNRINLIAQALAIAKGEKPPDVRKVTGRLIADVAHALASLTMLSGRIEAPAWLSSEPPFPASEILACKNGLVHLPSLVQNKPCFLPHTPSFFSHTCLDFDFNATAPAPEQWLKFLGELWPSPDGVIDPAITTLQEIMGYLISGETNQQKIFLLIGPTRSGKGTIGRVIRALLGAANVVSPTLSSLGGDFGLWPLLHKTVAIISDARLSGRADSAIITEHLLSISGEDPKTIHRKRLSSVDVTKLLVRFLILTNELPKLKDSSGALAGRFILVKLTKSWYGHENVGLTNTLLKELPSILNWSIEGWHRLRDRGCFIQPETSKDLVNDLRDLSSPVGAFVDDDCVVGSDYEVERSLLFAAWKKWCEKHEEKPGDAGTFGKNLRAAITIGDSQPRSDGKKVRTYRGLKLKEPETAKELTK